MLNYLLFYYLKKSFAVNLVLFDTLICNKLSVRSSFVFPSELFSASVVSGFFGVTSFLLILGVVTSALLLGVGVLFGVLPCENIPKLLGVSLERGVSKCFVANFLAAGDMLAILSVFVRNLKYTAFVQQRSCGITNYEQKRRL